MKSTYNTFIEALREALRDQTCKTRWWWRVEVGGKDQQRSTERNTVDQVIDESSDRILELIFGPLAQRWPIQSRKIR